MLDWTLLSEWLEFAVRWLHVITGIAWIGSSFYFIALDLGLRKRPDGVAGVHGEAWQVHGGGFYHIQKYLVAPDALPEHLTWFKWESYATWLSGFALLILVYYLGAELYLLDPRVLDMPQWAAIVVSAGSLGLGWLVYDLVCKSPAGRNDTLLMVVLFLILVAAAWGYTQVFSGRAALLHLGALTATIMTANVFLVIIPNQKIVVADLKAGRTPDANLGRVSKQRSTHNNYLTLPVLFLMLANHYPLAFATEFNWVIASLVFLMGVSIRHYFNTHHAGRGNPLWTWGVAGALFLLIVWLSSFPGHRGDGADEENAALLAGPQRFASVTGFEDIHNVIAGRCSMCHAREPFHEGVVRAPGGLFLESEADVARHARTIYLQAGRTDAMPPGNVSLMEVQERRQIVAWYLAGIGGESQ